MDGGGEADEDDFYSDDDEELLGNTEKALGLLSVRLPGRKGVFEPNFEELLKFLSLPQLIPLFEGVSLLHMMQLHDPTLCDTLLKVALVPP